MSVKTTVEGRIFHIVIDRPLAQNSLNRETNQMLSEAWRTFRDDEQLWVAVISGAGGKSFCAGADLKEMGDFKAMSPQQRKDRFDREPWLGGITHNLDIWKPIIAAIDGHCLGGGLELALTCDIRIATEKSSFALPEAKWGIVPAAGGTQRLPRIIGLSRALEMILTAREISAQRAFEIGLVNRVVPDGDALVLAVRELADSMLNLGPLALRAAKEAAIRGLSLPLNEALELEQFLAEINRNNSDAIEGPRAFAEKRKPEFKGK